MDKRCQDCKFYYREMRDCRLNGPRTRYGVTYWPRVNAKIDWCAKLEKLKDAA